MDGRSIGQLWNSARTLSKLDNDRTTETVAPEYRVLYIGLIVALSLARSISVAISVAFFSDGTLGKCITKYCDRYDAGYC